MIARLGPEHVEAGLDLIGAGGALRPRLLVGVEQLRRVAAAVPELVVARINAHRRRQGLELRPLLAEKDARTRVRPQADGRGLRGRLLQRVLDDGHARDLDLLARDGAHARLGEDGRRLALGVRRDLERHARGVHIGL